MESLLNRYRNITVLLLVIMAQLVLLAVSAKNDQDVRFIRIWTVTAVTPVARIIEGLRGGGSGFLHNYILLHDTSQENVRLRSELDKLKMENVFLKNELNTADRAKALSLFQAHTPSKTIAARIIGSGAGPNSKVVFVDRGTAAGVQRGMGVVTPDGIVGKVIAAYPPSSQVMLVTDSDFAAGVITQKGVRGTLRGQGTPQCKVDYVAFEEKIEPGELLYTSGDDRIFPRGFPVGVVKAVRPSQPFKEILVDPSGLQHGLEDVLIVIEGIHQIVPDAPSTAQPVYIAPPVPGSENKPTDATPTPSPIGTEADRLRSQYQALGEEQKHTYGENPPGTKPVDFTKLGGRGQPPAAQPGVKPPAGAPPQQPRTTPPPNPSAAPTGRGGGATDATRNPAPSGTTPANPVNRVPASPSPATKPGNPPVTPTGRGAGAADPGRNPSAAPQQPASETTPANPVNRVPATQPPATKPGNPPVTPTGRGAGAADPGRNPSAAPQQPPSETTPANPVNRTPASQPPVTKPQNPPVPPAGRGAGAAEAGRRANQNAGVPPGGQLR